MARRRGGQDDYASIDRGLVKAELKCDQDPSTLDVANSFDQTVSIHSSDCDCNAKRLKRELGAWRTSEFDDLGTASGTSRSRLNEIQDTSWDRITC